ncbi:hypothetical protein [Sutcliffiella cohnii]|uniref:hypothetical protein n=1 Tax=Sutcliffiella cohnii TaxID=33932 RepID=UPI000832B52B|nr:hypothetical protein [Sutcliffiella cohnii]
MKKHYSFNVNLEDVDITPELEEHFQMFGKIVRTVAPIKELEGILPKKVIESFPSSKRVLVVCNYDIGIMDVDLLENE